MSISFPTVSASPYPYPSTVDDGRKPNSLAAIYASSIAGALSVEERRRAESLAMPVRTSVQPAESSGSNGSSTDKSPQRERIDVYA